MRCFPVPLGSPEATETAKGKGPVPMGDAPRPPLLPLIASFPLCIATALPFCHCEPPKAAKQPPETIRGIASGALRPRNDGILNPI